MNARPEFLSVPEAGHDVFPASFAQQRLWFLEQLDGSGPLWNVRLPLRLGGPLDVAALEKALTAVVARHESLRTTFGMQAGAIVQFVAGNCRVPLERVELPAASEAELRQRLGELATHTFDLAEGPLLRICLVELAPDDHVLLLLSHHIVSDAWSSGILFRDLAASYAAFAAGELPQLPVLPIQYADFAVWQRDWLAGPELARQAAYWREHLAGASAVLDLPLDRPRPRLQSYRGNRLAHGLSAATTARLKTLAAEEGVTLFMLLFAAFNVLLARYCGQSDLVVGTPIAGRRRTELEGVIGFFANTLALRTHVDGDQEFRQLLQQVRATALDAFMHQDLPFEKLVEVVEPVRSLAHAPVFQVLFVLQNAPWDAAGFGDLTAVPVEIPPGDGARFDLSVFAAEFEGQLWLSLEYSTDLFDAGTITRLGSGFEALLTAILEDPAARIATLPVQAAADLARQLHEWQPAPTVAKSPADVYRLFRLQAERTPAATAVECAGVALSYAALDARTGEIAAQVQAAGMTGETPVAICLERSTDMLAALLGVLRAGGHYVPLDPAHPPARRALILRDSGAQLLIASSSAGGPAAVTPLPRESSPRVSSGRGVTAAGPPADVPAYLIYTSGSTGEPKGVVVPQRAVVNFLESMAMTPGLRAGDRLLAVTTLAFDIAVLELLLPVTVGATTVIAREDDLRDPQRLIDLLRTARITVLQGTPSLWRNLLAAGWEGVPGLRMLCGGEALDRELATQLLHRGAELWNLYGPTETTVWSCVERVRDEPGPVSIGRPVANTCCYVLDGQLQPVPIGARGELWIGGGGVALGYHDRPELTAGCFRPDPFCVGLHRGRRMYRTGDRARWRADGRLELLGRTDFQLKLRGFRIEPGEVETALLAHPGVAAAVVVLRDVASDARLVAYLVARDAVVADHTLQSALRATLPDYMVPSQYVWLAALPLTANGKVDRAALPSIALAGAASAGTSLPLETRGLDSRGREVPAEAAPASAIEMVLRHIYEDLLGAEVGIDDDFFARGGHSLLATRLVARVRAELHVRLPLRSVFENPTVRGLAAALPLPAVSVDAAPRPVARAPVTTAPLSLVQQRLWFLDRLKPGNSAYHLAWAFELRGALSQSALQAALDSLVVRHSSLRTRFRSRDGEPEQVIGAATGWPLQRVGSAEHLLAGVMTEATVVPFQLETGPALRALLVETAPDVHVLQLVIHHIVADGWSFGVLSRELSLCYTAAMRGVTPELPALHRDYADYAREQRRTLADGELARQLGYWQRQLHDAPPYLDLPTDRPRPARPSSRGARLGRTLPAELQASLRALAGEEGCTLFMVLLTGFDLLLARYTGTDDVLVGTPIAGRTQSDLEGLVGFFVNTLVLRTDLHGNPTVRELLDRVRTMALAAYEHADVPFELIVETLRPPRNIGRTPLFQVLFNLHSEPGVPLELEGLEVRPVAVPRHTAKFELAVSLAETPAGLAVTVEYSTDLFTAASIERFVTDYAVVLAAMVAAPAAQLTELPFSPAESAVLAGVARPEKALTLTAAFAEQVARNPAALAVTAPSTGDCAAVDWSYAELACAASAIDTALISQGVRTGDRVGLWFGHGAGQVAAILGVLQVGGVYVPLDTQAPVARLGAMLRDAGIRVVVTDRSAPAWQLPGVTLVRREELPAGAIAEPPRSFDPDAPAYLLYTSGTTGTPKPVAQTHRNVLHFVRAWAGNLGLSPEDRLSLLSTYGYDAAVQDLFGALLTGAAVCPLDVRQLDRTTLLDRIADRGLTVWHGTPTTYRYLFGGNVACRQDLTRLRLVVLGGEVAHRADWELFCARFRRGARFVNGYGLTEATAVTQWFADHNTQPYGQHLPIGRPLLKLKLVDASGALTPFMGEVVIESPHVAPGPGRFHTGDLARYLPDGNLAFVGRRDSRLKIGGIRIEPGDIETALKSHPAVLEVVVMAPEERAGEPVLSAWYTQRAEQPGLTLRALRSHLGALLPPALIPARFFPCEHLPRLPNGKVDRQSLVLAGAPSGATPLPLESSPRVSSGRGVAPEGAPAQDSAVHVALQEIWQTLLKKEGVGLDDDFFLLGGHSLLATRLVARIRDRLGVELPLIRVFEAPTIRGLALFLVPGGIQMQPRVD